MSNLNISRGRAAQGLVTNLAPAFKPRTGFDIKGEFNAVGAVADKLRGGVPADHIILTAALVARLAAEGSREERLPRCGGDRRGGATPDHELI